MSAHNTTGGLASSSLQEGVTFITADRLPIAKQPIYYRYFGPIQTSEVLGNREQTIAY